ncbi:MAG: ABC transporter ATP-binding protein [Oscillospiraceae bacterium]|nr:ABC transporter ATP-binding protein [Oscillospiraceae bacterium]
MISVKNLRAGYGGRQILNNVTVDFNDGEITSIIGPNGSGKSTLLQCCAGLLGISNGEILIDGKGITEYKGKALAQSVSYLPQNNSVSAITVRALVMHGRFPYLGYPRRYSREDIEIAENALETVGILDIADKQLSELSGGQQKKAHIAMRLAQNTNNVLFDEPTTFLDIKYKLELMKLAKRLSGEGKTVVAVLHDIELAFANSDKIVVVNNGEVAFCGFPSELVNSGVIESAFGVEPIMSEGKLFFKPMN